ncbi:MAG: hypothetical protein LC118_00825 [Dehalococcoidia bacterium]|nr:hypothetical protein [Dehalococcoidia bacterium]
MTEVKLAADGERALAEAQNFCWRTNVGIVAPEHLLGGALLVLGAGGLDGVPSHEAIVGALVAVQGVGDTRLDSNVMFGSAAREAITMVAQAVVQHGGTEIGALELALGTISSGEVNPMFYSSLGLTRTDLMAMLGG